MNRRMQRTLAVVVVVVGAFVATQSVAFAAPPDGPATDGAFLCPAVGDGASRTPTHTTGTTVWQ